MTILSGQYSLVIRLNISLEAKRGGKKGSLFSKPYKQKFLACRGKSYCCTYLILNLRKRRDSDHGLLCI